MADASSRAKGSGSAMKLPLECKGSPEMKWATKTSLVEANVCWTKRIKVADLGLWVRPKTRELETGGRWAVGRTKTRASGS